MIKIACDRKFFPAKSIIILVFALRFFCHSAQGLAEISITDSESTDEWASTDDYVEPFLITKTSKKLKISPETAHSLVKANLKTGILKIRGSYSSSGESIDSYAPEKYSLPPGFYEESQLEALKTCSHEKCLMKLNSAIEIPPLEKAKNKKEVYQEIIFNRLKAFLKSKQLIGYENRKSNEAAFKKMLLLVSSLNNTPKTLTFLRRDLWSNTPGFTGVVDSWVRQEIVNIAPDQMQPILRLSEIFEFKELDVRMFLEAHLYTNHYFDSSISFFEVTPEKKKPNECRLTVTDVMEIDELKKTALIRAMFKGKMVKAVTTYQRQFIESIEALSQKKSPLK